MATLSQWKKNVSGLVMGMLPGHDRTSATILVETYLTSTGGWSPDSTTAPQGEGDPVSGDTEQEAAISVRDTELARIFTGVSTVEITIKVGSVANMAPGSSDSSLTDELDAKLQSRVEAALALSDIDVLSFDWAGSSITSREGGSLDQSERQSISTEALSSGIDSDPVAIALAWARSAYGLDDTWGADRVYIRASTEEAYVSVKKYTNNLLSTLDGSTTYYYEIAIGTTSGVVTSSTRMD